MSGMGDIRMMGLIVAGIGVVALCFGNVHVAVPMIGLGLGSALFASR